MSQISVDLDSLAADGAALINDLTGGSAPSVEPASAHDTSVGVAANLTAQSQALDAYITNGLQKRNEGGAAHVITAANFRETEHGNTALISGNASTSEAISALTPVASVSDPVLPGIPKILPLAPKTGDAHAAALHSGNGAGSLRALAEYWQSKAATLDTLATETSQTSVAVNMHWSDSGIQTAGAKTAAHGNWWSETAGLCRALASVCNDAADQHDQAVAAMPTPQEFTDANNLVNELNTANQASGGLLIGQLTEAKALVALLHSQATETATTHHTASTATVDSTAGQQTAAPSIAGGNGPTGSVTQSGTVTANNPAPGSNGDPTGLSQLASNLGLPAAGTNGADSAAQNAQMMQMAQMASMLGMGGIAPMSALSGLGGLSRQNTPTGTEISGLPGGSGVDAGLSGDMADTLAAGAGGGVESISDAGAGAALPMASASHASPTAISGPASSLGLPAESAPTAAAGASGGGGGMSTYPPMMGAPGAGDAGTQRNMQLFPNRRMVSRPVPNTEAVFGELERDRRPRGKRAAKQQEGTNEG